MPRGPGGPGGAGGGDSEDVPMANSPYAPSSRKSQNQQHGHGHPPPSSTGSRRPPTHRPQSMTPQPSHLPPITLAPIASFSSGSSSPGIAPQLPPVRNSSPSPASHHSATGPRPASAAAAPSKALVPARVPLSDLEPDQVDPEYKKGGNEWWAIFNQDVVPRALDVSLSLTLTHERCVGSA